MNMFEIYRSGARHLASETMEYVGEVHRRYGISKPDWDLLTQDECWNIEQRQKVRSIIADCVMISLTIAGLPAQALPGQYVAAVIAELVSPVNMLVAATRAPDCYDAEKASGLAGEFEVRPMPMEQMQALVIAYAGHARAEPLGHLIPRASQDAAVETDQ